MGLRFDGSPTWDSLRLGGAAHVTSAVMVSTQALMPAKRLLAESVTERHAVAAEGRNREPRPRRSLT